MNQICGMTKKIILMNNTEKAQKVIEKIKGSNKFLILPDSRVDTDCVGTTLALKWWLNRLGKSEIDTYIFAQIPSRINFFPDIEQIVQKYPDKVNFDLYDIVFLIDNGKWDRFFTSKWQEIISNEMMHKIVVIDHHEFMDIYSSIPDQCIIESDNCTAKVFYDYFIKDSGIELDKKVSEYLYLALLGDTQIFRFGVNKDTYNFADKLIENGVEHNKLVVDLLTVKKNEIDAMVKAIENTHYYPEIYTTVLSIDEKLAVEIYGEDGEKYEGHDMLEPYRENFMRRVEGYHYSIIFSLNKKKNQTRVSWRIREDLAEVNIFKVMENMNYTGGGHPGAGGGWLNMLPDEAENRFISEMKTLINNS